MTELTLVEALRWVAHMCSVEEDSRIYAWPRSDEQLIEAAEWNERRAAVHQRMVEVAGEAGADAAWMTGMDKWEAANG